jgi:hypothetical protein
MSATAVEKRKRRMRPDLSKSGSTLLCGICERIEGHIYRCQRDWEDAGMALRKVVKKKDEINKIISNFRDKFGTARARKEPEAVPLGRAHNLELAPGRVPVDNYH